VIANQTPLETPPAWFCLRTQPKHEHIAAGHLRALPELEVFLPRIRFRRQTRRGAAWFTEALFPSYLFARFAWATSLRRVLAAPGVSTVIHFGDRWPTVPDAVMAELQALFGEAQLHEIPELPEVGEAVQVAGGALHGLQAVVTRVHPARQRVAVLLEFLGRQTAVELPLEQVVREENPRRRVR
jgi:transcriptional antiterminator RfaH